MTNTIPKIFRNNSHQKFFSENGYCKIEFGSVEELNTISNLFKKNIGNVKKYGFEGKKSFNEGENLKEVSEEIVLSCKGSIKSVFENITPFYATFLVKPNELDSEISLHQDWTNVDESKDISFGIWFPLVDVYRQNGALYFIPGSHKLTNSVRTNNPYPWPFSEVKKELMSYTKTVNCRKGEAIVINHKVIHGSHANLSKFPRNACVIGAKNKSAKMVHYYLEERTLNGYNLEKLVYKKEEFSKLLRNKKPNPIINRKLNSYQFPKFTLNEVLEKLEL